MRSRSAGSAGMSLVEALIVVSVAAILATVAIPGVADGIRHYQADSALESALMQLRLGRSLAVEQRQVYRVRFHPNGAVELVRQGDAGDQLVSRVTLPGPVAFRLEPGIPATGSAAPDGFSADGAIDMNNGDTVWFRPDGSAIGADGRPCNGVVHLSVEGYASTARAATLFGSTGRIRGWKYMSDSDGGGSWH